MTVETPRRAARPVIASSDTPHLPGRWVWTVDEFQRAYDLGIFGNDARLELLEGEIWRKTPQNEPHAWAIRAVEEALRSAFIVGHDVRVQLPLVFAPRNKPEPDIAVVTGTYNDYRFAHPTAAVLVVEISDSTLERDRTIKAAVYARAGIPEYWIVNLPDRVLEIYREPAEMASQPFGYHYRSIMRDMKGDSVTASAAPAFVLEVSNILP